MEKEADKESDMEDSAGNSGLASFWEGWAGGLQTLRHHIGTGVKVTCFPLGNCACHPFTTEEKK